MGDEMASSEKTPARTDDSIKQKVSQGKLNLVLGRNTKRSVCECEPKCKGEPGPMLKNDPDKIPCKQYVEHRKDLHESRQERYKENKEEFEDKLGKERYDNRVQRDKKKHQADMAKLDERLAQTTISSSGNAGGRPSGESGGRPSGTSGGRSGGRGK